MLSSDLISLTNKQTIEHGLVMSDARCELNNIGLFLIKRVRLKQSSLIPYIIKRSIIQSISVHKQRPNLKTAKHMVVSLAFPTICNGKRVDKQYNILVDSYPDAQVNGEKN